jgi:hypothetical protein
MISKATLCAALVCALCACGDRPKPSAASKPPSAQPSAYSQTPPEPGDAEDGDGVLREIERTVSRPAPEPMMPLLGLESAEPPEGESR